MKKRFKNPYFWIGVVGVAFTAMGVDVKTFTSWHSVYVSFITLINNPFLITSVGLAVMGVFLNPTTPGITDSEVKK